MGIIIFILVGVLVGWLAGLIFKGKGSGFLINLIVGVVGSWLGGWLLGGLIPLNGQIIWGVTVGGLITSVLGAVILLWIISLIRK
ncbi:MAG: GlsB/YeaQ/YmgE family stress response membrane protein [Bacteroidales bacterium]|nr:GlsB/YeaQ/YmgE family stress response membrane protein [Bacteroidales bacterium]